MLQHALCWSGTRCRNEQELPRLSTLPTSCTPHPQHITSSIDLLQTVMLKFNCQAVFDIVGLPFDSGLYEVDDKDPETVRLLPVSASPLARPGLTHMPTQTTALKALQR